MGQKTLTNPKIMTPAGFVLAGVLLAVCQEPVGLAPLAWVAWVPFLLVCGERLSTRRLLGTAYLAGLAYWVWSLHWLYIVTLPGYLMFSLFLAGYWPVLAYCVRFARRKGWPLFVWAPMLFVGAEALQGYLFTGFSWFFLAHSQYALLGLIQICDIFGALGVSVLVAMVNGLAADWVLGIGPCERRIGRHTPPRFYLRLFCSTALCILLVGATYLYGQKRLAETPACLTEGPLVGSVQPNVPANVKEEIDNGPKILAEMIASSRACVDAGANVVAWPETMVLAVMNPEYMLANYSGSAQATQFHQQILAFCKDRCFVLLGAPALGFGNVDGRYGITDQYNSAFLYRPDGTADPKRYDKIHLVPFGEYIPFKTSAPWIYRMILFLSPYNYDYNLTSGTEYTLFEVDAEEREWRFGVLICYEDTDPTVTRRHVLDENGNKRCDWLVNISNDGWYVIYNPEDAKTFSEKVKKFILRGVFRIEQVIIPMGELRQRTAISAFRCVENRISIIRSVNTGISCLIEPTGKIRDGYHAGNLPDTAMDRQGVDGWFVDRIPMDSRVTFFSRHGRWLDVVLGTLFVLNIGYSVYGSRKTPLESKGAA